MSGRTTIGTAGTSTKLLCDALGKLQVDVVGGVGGDATAANQALQISEATEINTAVTSLDNKITVGEDIIVGGAGGLQQVLMYGKTASGGNNLQPVELTGDRLIVDVQELNVGFTQNSSGSMTQAGAVQIYGGYDDGLGGARKMRTLKTDDNGVLDVAGTVAVSGGNIAVTGTVAVAGVATETTLSALNTKVTACDTGSIAGTVAVSGVSGTVAVSATALPLPGGASSETTLSALNTKVTACDTGSIAGSVKVGNTVGDGTGTGTFLKTATDGSMHVVVENSDNVLIKGIQDGTSTQKDAKTNSNGDLRSALIGNTVKDGSGDNHYVLVDSDGKLVTSGGGGGGGGSQQYDGGTTLPNPTIGTAVLGVDSGGLANVISTDDTGKIQSVIHGEYSGVAYSIRVNPYSRAISVANSVTRAFQSSDYETIAAGTNFQSGYVHLSGVRSLCIYGRTTNLTDKIILYCKRTSYLATDIFKMPSQYDITPDSTSGDFFLQMDNCSLPYLVWGKDNSTASSETIEVHFGYTD